MQDVLGWIDRGIPYAGAALVGVSAAVAFGREFVRDLFSRNDHTATAHGSARWAKRRDMQQAGLFEESGLFLGYRNGFLSTSFVRVHTDRHLLTIAPSRAGKGVSAIVPNLLTYPGSVFVIDPKGENAALTAARRRALGHDVHILDPWKITGYFGSSFNPIGHLSSDGHDLIEEATLVAEALVPSGHSGLDSFWDEEAKSLLSGLILYLVCCEGRDFRTLTRLREILTFGKEEFAELLKYMAACDAAHGRIARCANRLLQKEERERASVISSAQSHTHFLDSPSMDDVLGARDFLMGDLKHRPTTIYLVLPTKYLESHARWLRLILSVALSSLADTPGDGRHYPVLFLLDEFAAMGRLKSIETAIGLMAGYGVQLWPFVQDISQLRDLYPKRWQSFIANAGVLQAFGVNDAETAEILCRKLGTMTVTVRTDSQSHNPSGEGGNISYGVSARPLLYPAEIMKLPPNEQLLFVHGVPPIRAHKLNYYQDQHFKQLIPKNNKMFAGLSADG